MNTLREAFEMLKGYCEKHSKCSRGCIFHSEDCACMLQNGEVPEDWEFPKNGEET